MKIIFQKIDAVPGVAGAKPSEKFGFVKTRQSYRRLRPYPSLYGAPVDSPGSTKRHVPHKDFS
jgi:hypothetical protein